MTVAYEVASKMTALEVAAVRDLSNGHEPTEKMAKYLKELKIYDPKTKRPLTLYGKQVIRILKEIGKWES